MNFFKSLFGEAKKKAAPANNTQEFKLLKMQVNNVMITIEDYPDHPKMKFGILVSVKQDEYGRHQYGMTESMGTGLTYQQAVQSFHRAVAIANERRFDTKKSLTEMYYYVREMTPSQIKGMQETAKKYNIDL